MAPVNWLMCRVSSVRLVRSPSCVGMAPVNWLLARLSCVRLVRLPSAGGMVPVRLLPSRNSMVTPSVVLAVTPSHKLRAVLAAQFSVAVPRMVSFSSSSVLQSWVSRGSEVGSGGARGARGWALGSGGRGLHHGQQREEQRGDGQQAGGHYPLRTNVLWRGNQGIPVSSGCFIIERLGCSCPQCCPPSVGGVIFVVSIRQVYTNVNCCCTGEGQVVRPPMVPPSRRGDDGREPATTAGRYSLPRRNGGGRGRGPAYGPPVPTGGR